jgi:protein kinase X
MCALLIAPEVIINAELGRDGEGYGMSVDYYSLGVLIYEMLVGQTPFHDNNARAIYRRVLYGNVEYPWSMDTAAKDLIKRLLCRNISKRLGCTDAFPPHLGFEEIKRHRWFKDVDWDQLRRKEVSPPFVPKFSHAGDTSNFIPWGRDKKSADHDNSVSYGDAFHNF